MASLFLIAALQIVMSLGLLFRWWTFTNFPFVLIFLPVFLLRKRREITPEAWEPIRHRLEMTSLPTLLDAYALKILELDNAISAGLIKRLTLATPEELALLTLEQRKQLVQFTLAQLRMHWSGPQSLHSIQIQAATLGYLTLATLRQPGAERPDRRGFNTSHANLREAIEEYLASVKAEA